MKEGDHELGFWERSVEGVALPQNLLRLCDSGRGRRVPAGLVGPTRAGGG